jgi:predicted TPR repeat methyltransferase
VSHEPQPQVASAYDQLAERWTDERFSKVDGVAQHERAAAFLGSRSAGWALNVGCGCNTRFNALLKAQGRSVEAVDLSERMVALARAADPGVQVHHADICTWEPTRQYAFITAWDSLWHVPLASQREVMLKLMRALEEGGVLLFTAGGLDTASEHWDATMGPSVYYGTLGIPGLLATVEQAGCVLRHFEFDQWPEKHLCVIVQRV